MFSRKPKTPLITPKEAFNAKPVRLVNPEIEPAEDGGGRIQVEVLPRKWFAFFSRQQKMKRSFHFDPIGLYVWSQIDGKTSVRRIIQKLAKKYDLNLREAEVPTLQYLRTLTKKGLIGLPAEDRKPSR